MDAGQKRAKAPAANAENMSVGTDKVLMPPPPPSASKKTPLKSPSSSYNSNANSYATEMKPYASQTAAYSPGSKNDGTEFFELLFAPEQDRFEQCYTWTSNCQG